MTIDNNNEVSIMTQEELAAIKNRANAATPPPWKLIDKAEQIRLIEQTSADIAFDFNLTIYDRRGGSTKANLDFILNSRQDVPNLLAHIEELEEELDHFRNWCAAPDLPTSTTEAGKVKAEFDQFSKELLSALENLITYDKYFVRTSSFIGKDQLREVIYEFWTGTGERR